MNKKDVYEAYDRMCTASFMGKRMDGSIGDRREDFITLRLDHWLKDIIIYVEADFAEDAEEPLVAAILKGRKTALDIPVNDVLQLDEAWVRDAVAQIERKYEEEQPVRYN